MRALGTLIGSLILCTILWDAFETVILPRRVTRRIRLASTFFRATWFPWRAAALRMRSTKRREAYFSYYGPLSLLALFVVWFVGLVFAFALVHWGIGSALNSGPNETPSFETDLYMSGTTFFTLGLGDVTPRTPLARVLTVTEAGVGFGFLAVVISYLPVLYGAFSRREVNISLLDARAGSPPSALELLRRHAQADNLRQLGEYLGEWESWAAELLESHLSYPLLCYFRSQHNNQSWLSALTAILDTSALLISGVRGPEARQAQLTFAMARHAMVDLAQIFSCRPVTVMPDRLPPERYQQMFDLLCQSGIKACHDSHSSERLREMRALYEGYAEALSRYLVLPLPEWIMDKPRKDNWMTVARVRKQAEDANPDHGESPAATRSIIAADDHYNQF